MAGTNVLKECYWSDRISKPFPVAYVYIYRFTKGNVAVGIQKIDQNQMYSKTLQGFLG